MRVASRFVLFVLVWAVALPAGADDERPPRKPIGGLSFANEIELTVVNVQAYVTDEDGMAVTDLEADDFRITQDGVPRKITHFQLYTEDLVRHHQQRDVAPGIDAAAQENPDLELDIRPVYMVIYVDNQNLKPLDRNRVLRQIRDFVREHLFPPVQMMVVSHQRSLEIVVPFTSDQGEVITGLRDIMRDSAASESRDAARRDLLDKMNRARQDNRSSQSNNYHSLAAQVYNYAEEEANDLSFTIGALREMVTTMSGLPGKKTVLYVSNGLPMVAGLELFYTFASTYNDPSALSQAPNFDQSKKFNSLIATANAQDVSIYTVGAGGLRQLAMATAEYAAPQDTISSSVGDSNFIDSLRLIAERTGGAAIVNTNDISGGLVKVSQDFFTYYSLGYTLNASGTDKVHDIKVELPDHPDYNLRYRRRFVEKSIETRVQDAVITGLMFPIDDNPMQLAFEVGTPAPASTDRWVVPLKVSFPLRKIALLPEGEDYVSRVTMFIAARDRDGDQSDVVRQEHEIRIPAELYEDSQRERFTITASMLMKSGVFNVVVGLLDPITRQSSYASVRAVVHPEE